MRYIHLQISPEGEGTVLSGTKKEKYAELTYTEKYIRGTKQIDVVWGTQDMCIKKGSYLTLNTTVGYNRSQEHSDRHHTKPDIWEGYTKNILTKSIILIVEQPQGVDKYNNLLKKYES